MGSQIHGASYSQVRTPGDRGEPGVQVGQCMPVHTPTQALVLWLHPRGSGHKAVQLTDEQYRQSVLFPREHERTRRAA
jgi:hypothetical protein